MAYAVLAARRLRKKKPSGKASRTVTIGDHGRPQSVTARCARSPENISTTATTVITTTGGDERLDAHRDVDEERRERR